MKMEHKVVPVTGFKVIDAARGIVGAFVSVTGVVDEVRDRIIPGAYQKTLISRTPKGVWSHDWDNPISKTLAAEELLPGDDRLPTKTRDGQDWPSNAGALYVETQFNIGDGENPGTQSARDALSNVMFYGEDQEWCADEDTEILTARGWLRYSDLTTDDEAYVIDPATLAARFEPVLTVNVFEAKPRTLRLVETGNFSSLTTADHRWLVAKRSGDGDRWAWRTTADLTYQHGIFRASHRDDAPTEAKWADAFVEVVAWYWTEGWRTASGHSDSAAYIGQSNKNALHQAAIRSALDAAFLGGWTEQAHGDVAHFRLGREATEAVLSVTEGHKAPTTAFLLSLTTAQLLLFIERCLDGDGHRSPAHTDEAGYEIAGYRRWYQVEESSVRRFEMACAMAGLATNTYQTPDYGNRHGRPPFVVSILASQMAKPLDAVRVASYASNRQQPATDALVQHDGIVWCPTTPSGTWLARRRGSVYFTGNSIGYNVPPGASKVDGKSGVRELTYIDLFEYSPVLFGAMPLTATAGFKDVQDAWHAKLEAGEVKEGQFFVSEVDESKKAIPKHKTDTSEGSWSASTAKSNLSNDDGKDTYRQAFAWVDDSANADKKAAYKFIHHEVASDGTVGAANTSACSAGIGVLNGGRGGTTIPDADRQGVYNHLAKHLKDAGKTAPDLKAWEAGDVDWKSIEGDLGEAETPTPVSTPADPQYQADPSAVGSGTGAGVTVEPRPVVDVPGGKVEEFTVTLNDKGLAATEEVRAWAVAEAAKEGASLAAIVAEMLAKGSAIMADPANVVVSAVEVKAFLTLAGCYEERQRAIRDALVEWDIPGQEAGYWGNRYWPTVEATFDDRVVVAVYDLEEDDDPRFFEGPYVFDGDDVELGVMVEVELAVNVVPVSTASAASLRSALAKARVDVEGFVPATKGTEPAAPEDEVDLDSLMGDIMEAERIRSILD